MGKRHTLFISTDPNNNVPIGVPGQSIFIGSPGPTIYGRGPAAIQADSLEIDLTNMQIDYTGGFEVQFHG